MPLCKIIKESSITAARWSGGETRQIYIHPKEAVYENRDFEYRISSATVAVDNSTFTFLDGFNRYIMSLTNSICLIHNKNTSLELKPFISHSFKGSEHTECFGRCIDFNLMVKEPSTGSLTPLQFNNEYNLNNTVGIYFLENNSEIILSSSDKNETIAIDKGDFIVLKRDKSYKCKIIGNNKKDIAAISAVIY